VTWHHGDPIALLGVEPMVTIVLVLLVAAFILTILSAMGRVQLWISVLLLVIAGLLGAMPILHP
jgi:hypothetical protein